jgi:hypothetical protein
MFKLTGGWGCLVQWVSSLCTLKRSALPTARLYRTIVFGQCEMLDFLDSSQVVS